jgi:hypothetical protein
MPPQPVPPVFAVRSFSCPHCGAHANQTWFTAYSKRCDDDKPPHPILSDFAEEFASRKPQAMEQKQYDDLSAYFNKAAS